MKAMFYGGAVAAVSGLLMGAGFKTPADAFDVRGAAEDMPYIQNADFGDESAQTAPVTPVGYQPDYLNGVAYVPAALQETAPAAETEASVTAAVYTVEDSQDLPDAPRTYASLSETTPAAAPRLMRSAPAAPEPQPAAQAQGFYMVDDTPDPS